MASSKLQRLWRKVRPYVGWAGLSALHSGVGSYNSTIIAMTPVNPGVSLEYFAFWSLIIGWFGCGLCYGPIFGIGEERTPAIQLRYENHCRNVRTVSLILLVSQCLIRVAADAKNYSWAQPSVQEVVFFTLALQLAALFVFRRRPRQG